MPLSSLFIVTMLPFAFSHEWSRTLESEIKEDEGDAGLSGIDTTTHPCPESEQPYKNLYSRERGTEKGGGGEGKSLSEGIFANT